MEDFSADRRRYKQRTSHFMNQPNSAEMWGKLYLISTRVAIRADLKYRSSAPPTVSASVLTIMEKEVSQILVFSPTCIWTETMSNWKRKMTLIIQTWRKVASLDNEHQGNYRFVQHDIEASLPGKIDVMNPLIRKKVHSGSSNKAGHSSGRFWTPHNISGIAFHH